MALGYAPQCMHDSDDTLPPQLILMISPTHCSCGPANTGPDLPDVHHLIQQICLSLQCHIGLVKPTSDPAPLACIRHPQAVLRHRSQMTMPPHSLMAYDLSSTFERLL